MYLSVNLSPGTPDLVTRQMFFETRPVKKTIKNNWLYYISQTDAINPDSDCALIVFGVRLRF